jgi:hypothetical protein
MRCKCRTDIQDLSGLRKDLSGDKSRQIADISIQAEAAALRHYFRINLLGHRKLGGTDSQKENE